MRAGVAVIVALLVGAMSSGCSAVEPIEVGSAPTVATSRVDLPLLPGVRGIYPVVRWPNACGLLTDLDLRAVFPQAADVVREPEALRLTVLPDPLTGGGGRYVVPDAQCTFRFSVPGSGVEPGDTWSGYVLKLDVDAVGSREFVAENHADSYRRGQRRVVVAGADCAAGVVQLACARDRLAFSVQDLKGNVTQDGGVARFRRGGKLTTFESGSVGIDQQHEFVTSVVLPELVKAVLAKV